MVSPSRTERELAHWKEWQSKADQVWGWQTPAGQARARRRAGLFRELTRMSATSEALEVGCGTGEFTLRVAPHVQRLQATDLSPDLLERAKAKSDALGLTNVRFDLQDVTAMTLPENQFDAVFGCSMLHHVEAAKALGQIFRVLKPGGWCSFSEPNMLNPQIAVQKNVGFVKRRVGDTPDETAFFRWELARLLREAGFVSIEVRNFDFLHPLTPPKWIPLMERWTTSLERIPLLKAISGSLIFQAQKPASEDATST